MPIGYADSGYVTHNNLQKSEVKNMRWKLIGLAIGFLLMAVFDNDVVGELWGGGQ